MKAKIYPLSSLKDETITIPCSTFLFSVELILASLASGTSTIHNVPKKINETLLDWARQIGATIKVYQEKVVVRGTNNHLDIKNSMFVSEDLKTINLFLPILASFLQPIGIKTSKENIIALTKHKENLEKFGCLYFEEDNKIRIERELSPLDLSFAGNQDLSFVVSYLIVAPLLNGTSKIKLNIPVFYYNDYKTIIRIFKKFKVEIKINKDMTLEIPGNQRYRACNIKTEMDSYFASIFAILANHYKQKIKIKGYTHHYFNDGMFFDYLNGKEFIAKRKYFSYRKDTYPFFHLEASLIRGGIPFGVLLFLMKNRNGNITRINDNDPYQANFINIFTNGLRHTGIRFERVKGNIDIEPVVVDRKFQFDAKNNTYVALTMAFVALISKAPITIKNIEGVFKKYPTFFDNLLKLGAKIEYIHD